MPDLIVKIDPSVPDWVEEGVISFETGVQDSDVWCYEHHHTSNPRDTGALTTFYQDVLMGREMPTTFHTKKIGGIDTLMAIALFLDRTLMVKSETMDLVANVDFVHRLGLSALALQSEERRNLFTALQSVVGLSTTKELESKVPQAVQWIQEFLNSGKVPTHSLQKPNVRVIEQGTGGFVIAEADDNIVESWLELYRTGFLKGMLFVQGQIIISKKSFLVPFNLVKAASVLNAAEGAATGSASSTWIVSPDELWLYHVEPTVLLASDVLTVLTHS